MNDGTAEWVTMDMFDTDDNDLVIEHWDIIEAYEENPDNPHTQVDGESTVTDLKHTARNKEIVRNFTNVVLIERQLDKFERYISQKGYIDHNQTTSGRSCDLLNTLSRQSNGQHTYQYKSLFKVIGQGNFILTYGTTFRDGIERASLICIVLVEERSLSTGITVRIFCLRSNGTTAENFRTL